MWCGPAIVACEVVGQGKRPTPTTHYGAWANQVRIGQLTPEGEDKWWPLLRGTDADSVTGDALGDLLMYGVPWLREHAKQ